MILRRTWAGLLALSVGLSPMSMAVAADDPAPAKTEAEQKLDETEAATKQQDAENKLAQSRLTALGLKTFSGGVTVEDSAGGMETALLSGATLDQAARYIAADALDLSSTGRPVLIVGVTETVDLAIAEIVEMELDNHLAALRTGAGDPLCLNPPRHKPVKPAAVVESGPKAKSLPSAPAASSSTESPTQTKAVAPATLTAIGTILSLFQTETTVKGHSFTPSERALINAVAGQPGRWMILSDVAALPRPAIKGRDDLRTRWSKMLKERAAVDTCIARLEQAEQKGQVPGAVAALKGLVAKTDAMVARIVTPEEGAPSPFVQALRAEYIASEAPLVLRLSIEKSGGSVLQQKNVLTLFGHTGVRISGGLVVSYRFSDPLKGYVLGGGSMTCRTDMASFKQIQRGDITPPHCKRNERLTVSRAAEAP